MRALLSLYFIANPPFIGTDFGIPREGHYLFIDRTLVEIIGLGLLAVFPSGMYFGLDRFLTIRFRKKPSPKKHPENSMQEQAEPDQIHRREILRYMAMVPVLGTFAWGAARKYQWNSVNAISGATIKINETKLKDLKGELPFGKILDKQVSRVIAGGNLIGGWSHARDLIYVSKLFKAYNTENKRIFGSNLQTITQVHPKKEDIYSHVDKVIDLGVDFIQIQGNCCDWRVRDNEIDVLVKCIDHIRQQGYPAGLGAHSVQALIACDQAGIEPDFFMKTFHHDNYWSAHPEKNRFPFTVDGKRSGNHDDFHDNMFCLFAEETDEFMKKKEIPWIAFKVLAGGAIHPEDGFRYAFEKGADFICVGMFDWQIVEDVNIALDVLDGLGARERRWYS